MDFSVPLLWFFVGVAFLIAEMMLPAFILIFFTAGSWIAGIFAWLVTVDLREQIVIFIISSLVLLLVLRKYSLRIFKGRTTQGIDDTPLHGMIGKTALVTSTIRPNQEGEIKMQGSFWRAVADTEIAEGRSVVVLSKTSQDSLTFKVQEVKTD